MFFFCPSQISIVPPLCVCQVTRRSHQAARGAATQPRELRDTRNSNRPGNAGKPDSKEAKRQSLQGQALYAGSCFSILLFVLVILDWQVCSFALFAEPARHLTSSIAHCQARFGVTEAGMTELLMIFSAVLPSPNNCPTFRQSKTMMLGLGLTPRTTLVICPLEL